MQERQYFHDLPAIYGVSILPYLENKKQHTFLSQHEARYAILQPSNNVVQL